MLVLSYDLLIHGSLYWRYSIELQQLFVCTSDLYVCVIYYKLPFLQLYTKMLNCGKCVEEIFDMSTVILKITAAVLQSKATVSGENCFWEVQNCLVQQFYFVCDFF